MFLWRDSEGKHGWVLEEYLDYLKEMQLSEESGEEEQ